MKNGRIPEGILKCIGFWKAEEYQKFTFPPSEYVLGGILRDKCYNSWVLLVRITELILSSRTSGYTAESLKLLEKLIWRHNILTEESKALRVVPSHTTTCSISMRTYKDFLLLIITGALHMKEQFESAQKDLQTKRIWSLHLQKLSKEEVLKFWEKAQEKKRISCDDNQVAS